MFGESDLTNISQKGSSKRINNWSYYNFSVIKTGQNVYIWRWGWGGDSNDNLRTFNRFSLITGNKFYTISRVFFFTIYNDFFIFYNGSILTNICLDIINKQFCCCYFNRKLFKSQISLILPKKVFIFTLLKLIPINIWNARNWNESYYEDPESEKGVAWTGSIREGRRQQINLSDHRASQPCLFLRKVSYFHALSGLLSTVEPCTSCFGSMGGSEEYGSSGK